MSTELLERDVTAPADQSPDASSSQPSGKVDKRQLVRRVAQRSGVPTAVAAQVCDALLQEVVDAVSRDEAVTLHRFGRFYLQRHRGHKVRFGHATIPDYAVLKFSASNTLNRRLDSFLQRD